MSDKVLYIHMGIPKTGTTSLQNYMVAHGQEMMDRGVCYPDIYSDLPELRKTHMYSSANASVFTTSTLYGLDRDVEAERKIWDLVLKRLEKYDVILSCEGIWKIDIRTFLNEVLDIYSNVKVIVYLRAQQKWIDSMWKQMIKTEETDKSFDEFFVQNKDALCYYDKVATIESVIGRENLILKKYEGQDTIQDFLDIFHIADIYTNAKKVGKQYNPSISEKAANYKRTVNRVTGLDDVTKMSYGYFIMPEVEKLLADEKSFQAECEELCNQIKEENKLLEQHYQIDLGTDLSYAEIEHDKVYSQEQMNEIVKYMMIKERQRTQFWLEPMFEQSMKARLKGRKLAYYGGGALGSRIINEYELRPDCIIDSNLKSSELLGVKVISPKQIDHWEDYYVVITTSDYDTVMAFLESKGMKYKEDYITAYEIF